MLTRHPPECFKNGRHVDLNGRECDKQNEILIEDRGWVPNPFGDCNLSDVDAWCYVHESHDCSRLFWIWYLEVSCG